MVDLDAIRQLRQAGQHEAARHSLLRRRSESPLGIRDDDGRHDWRIAGRVFRAWWDHGMILAWYWLARRP